MGTEIGEFQWVTCGSRSEHRAHNQNRVEVTSLVRALAVARGKNGDQITLDRSRAAGRFSANQIAAIKRTIIIRADIV